MSIRDRVIYADDIDHPSSELFGDEDPRTPAIFGPPPPAGEVYFALSNAAHAARKKLRSCYIRWALTVNAIHVASGHYKNTPSVGLGVHFIRQKGIYAPGPYVGVILDNKAAYTNTGRCLEVIAAYGIYDIYGCFEEIVFEVYEALLWVKPFSILQDKQYRDLKRLHRNRLNSLESRQRWKAEFSERITTWRRKRTYDSLPTVFKALVLEAGLNESNVFIDDKKLVGLARILNIVSELRNVITHGGHTVTDRLSELCLGGADMLFPFKVGEEIHVTNEVLAAVEFYFDQIILDIYNAATERLNA